MLKSPAMISKSHIMKQNPRMRGIKDKLPDWVNVMGQLTALKKELGDKFPRILLLISECRDFDLLGKTLERISPQVAALIQEITVFKYLQGETLPEIFNKTDCIPAFEKLRLYRTSSPCSYGDTLKIGFDYAGEKRFDYLIVFRGDGRDHPDAIPMFIWAALKQDHSVVLGRRLPGLDSERSFRRFSSIGMLNRILSTFAEWFLHMRVKDYHCGYRLFSTDILRRIPYRLNAPDYLFDLQILIQVRILGVRIGSVNVPDFQQVDMGPGKMTAYALRSVATVLGYRLHQLHIFRKDIYFVDLGERYTLKRSCYSSHMQILASLKDGSLVLDLGCGQGALAQEYANRRLSVVGVDNISPDKVFPQLQNYVRQDLESELDLPYGRIFDYIVLSDVIEHIKNRNAIMKSLRRYLKADGQVIISTGNIAIWFYRLSLLLGRFEYGPKGILDRTHVHLFTLDSFTRFIQENGYQIQDVNYTPIPFELVLSSTGRSALIESITRWYYYLARVWPRMFAYQFVVKCTFSSFEAAGDEEMKGTD